MPKIVVAMMVAAAVLVVFLVWAGPSIARRMLYPKPQRLPAIVQENTASLLAKWQTVLEKDAPAVAAVLRPGLTDAEIAALESEGGFRLSDDLKAFYRWHDGTDPNSPVGLLPGHRFVPLKELIQGRAGLRKQVAAGSMVQRAAFAIFAGHRLEWVHVLDDGAGDGYFFDPQRTEDQGAFFYNFAEDGQYLWFPSFRNFLSGAIECYEKGLFRFDEKTQQLEEDYERTAPVWDRLAKPGSIGG